MASLNFSKIISGISSATQTVNKVIPIYKEITPIAQNIKSAFKTVTSVKKAVKEKEIEEIKSLERPVTNFKKKSDERSTNLDTLTFFQ